MLCATASRYAAASFDRDDEPVEPTVFCLEYFPEAGGTPQQVVLDTFPFRLGRSAKAHLTIARGELSREHAEIDQVGDRLLVRDLGSTNGTFINGQRIHSAQLADGDILHLAHQEFRVLAQQADRADNSQTDTCHMGSELRKLVGQGRSHLENLLSQGRVRALFQPIVDLQSGVPLGFEALGRGTHRELSSGPGELFTLADRYHKARELSQVFRAVAVKESQELPGCPVLFFNLHPSELRDPLLTASLEQLRRGVPRHQTIVLEIHEDTVADLTCLRDLREQLHKLNILLAYDDFGAGQSRLTELAEAPPDFLKLNITLVRDLHLSPQRQSLVKAIIHIARDLGIQVIAEGIETEEEALACKNLGCHFGQGYWLGRPALAALFTAQHDTWEIAFEVETEEGLHSTVQVAL